MFVTMKKLLCLLTVCLMCAVSYGTTTGTAEKKEVKMELKVAVIGVGMEARAKVIAEVLLMNSDATLIFAQTTEKTGNVAEAMKIAFSESINPRVLESFSYKDFERKLNFEKIDYDNFPIMLPEKPKQNFSFINKKITSRAKPKHKFQRQPRNSI